MPPRPVLWLWSCVHELSGVLVATLCPSGTASRRGEQLHPRHLTPAMTCVTSPHSPHLFLVSSGYQAPTRVLPGTTCVPKTSSTQTSAQPVCVSQGCHSTQPAPDGAPRGLVCTIHAPPPWDTPGYKPTCGGRATIKTGDTPGHTRAWRAGAPMAMLWTRKPLRDHSHGGPPFALPEPAPWPSDTRDQLGVKSKDNMTSPRTSRDASAAMEGLKGKDANVRHAVQPASV